MRYVNDVCLIIATFADLFIKCACLILTNISFVLSFTLLKKGYTCIMEYLHIFHEILTVNECSYVCMFALCQFLKYENYIYGLRFSGKGQLRCPKKEQRSATHNSLQNKVYKIYDAK